MFARETTAPLLRGALLAMSAFATLPVASREARADGATLAGSWTASPMSEAVTVNAWATECGPKPVGASSPGGSVRISVSGDELVFSGGKAFRTDQCWDMGLARRVSHSATPSIRWWKTKCESPPGDPRVAAITTVVRAVDDDTIVLTENARYSSTVASGACAATVERSRTYKLVARDGAPAPPPPSASTAPPAPASAPTTAPSPAKPSVAPGPALDCSSPGEAATLEVRPRKKRLRPGDAFDFRARLADAKGCELPAKPTFRLAPESASLTSVTVEATGHVKVGPDAAPGGATLLVEAAGKSAKVELEVLSDQAYADLLASGGDDAAAEESAVAIVVTGGGGSAKVVEAPKPEETRRTFGLLAVAGGVCTLFGLAALLFWRRGNAKADAERLEREAARDAERRARRAKRSESPSAQPAEAARAGSSAPAAMQGKRCPTCGAQLPPHAQFCPEDGTRLDGVAAANAPAFARAVVAPAENRRPPNEPRGGPAGRLCPVCGGRYGAEASFCSKDGTSLVPLN